MPTIPFDGDCTQVLTAEQLNELLGEGWMTRAEWLESHGIADPSVGPDSIGTLGGLECGWHAAVDAAADRPGSLTVTLLAPDSVPAQFAGDYSAVTCDPVYDWTTCRIGSTVKGTWVMVAFGYGAGATGDLVEPGLSAVARNLVDPLASRAVDRQSDWWTLPACESLGEGMRLEELLGAGYVNGYWEGSASPDDELLEQAGVELRCPWFSDFQVEPDGHITSLALAAGAAWNWDEIVATTAAEDVVIGGAKDAVFVKYPPYSEGTLYATDGVNVLVSRGTLDFATQMAERALAALAD